MTTYLVPSEKHRAEIEIKKSRFIAYALPITSRAQALEEVATLKSQYPDARHVCWAYLIGDPHQPKTQAFDDAGEPSGTAGKPILNVLQHKNVGDILLVVVRYFGGIKLGAGGLTRAYGQAAQAVMETLPTTLKVAKTTLVLRCDFAHEQALRHLVASYEGEVESVMYAQEVTVSISLPQSVQAEFSAQLYGIAELQPCEEGA